MEAVYYIHLKPTRTSQTRELGRNPIVSLICASRPSFIINKDPLTPNMPQSGGQITQPAYSEVTRHNLSPSPGASSSSASRQRASRAATSRPTVAAPPGRSPRDVSRPRPNREAPWPEHRLRNQTHRGLKLVPTPIGYETLASY